MIRNERENRITLAQAAAFERSLTALMSEESDVSPLIRQAQIDATRSQLEDLKAELAEYEALKTGRRRVLELSSLEELPKALIKGRIVAGLTQKDLADKLGVTEQQVQRDEASEYASASLTRLTKIATTLKLGIREEIFLPNVDISTKALVRRLTSVGLDRNFLSRRLGIEASRTTAEDAGTALKYAGAVHRVFGWTPAELLASEGPLATPRAAGAYFKLPANAAETKTFLLASYAKHIARLVSKAVPEAPARLTADPRDFRSLLPAKVNLSGLLQLLWNCGVPVIPLTERGAFHAACWRFAGRNVIVLKQQTRSEARWLHDLLHEVHHAAQRPELLDFEQIDQDLTPRERRNAPEEDAATSFAGEILLDGRAEALAEECVTEAAGKVERLKLIVPRVASKNGVSTSALANYMAWRLSLQSIDWWGTATNLQEQTDDPWTLTHRFLADHLNWSSLDEGERDILTRALTEE